MKQHRKRKGKMTEWLLSIRANNREHEMREQIQSNCRANIKVNRGKSEQWRSVYTSKELYVRKLMSKYKLVTS